jgi:DNA polymerase III alpha subunit (gram-positive type)
MMFHCVRCRAHALAGEVLFQKNREPHPRAPITEATEQQANIRALYQRVVYFSQQVGTAVLIKSDVVYIGKADARFTQTICDRLGRESRPMLRTTEPLLLRGSD